MIFQDFRRQISSPALDAVAGHWNEARGLKSMPSWEDLRPAAIAGHLALIWAFRFDRRTRAFTARLAGERISQGFQRSFRGLPLKELHAPQYFPKIYANALGLVDGPCLSHRQGKLFRQHQRFGVGERVCLPLSSDGIFCDGVLGASDYSIAPADAGDGTIELLVDGEQYVPLHPPRRNTA